MKNRVSYSLKDQKDPYWLNGKQFKPKTDESPYGDNDIEHAITQDTINNKCS